jgi:hypothetical protein
MQGTYQFYIKKKQMKFQAEMLKDALKEKYKAEIVYNKMINDFKDKIAETIFEEYGSNYKILGGEKFILTDIDILFHPSIEHNNKAQITILYTSASKLTKAKRERINEINDKFKISGYVEESKHKIPLWFVSSYELHFEDILQERFNLIHHRSNGRKTIRKFV